MLRAVFRVICAGVSAGCVTFAGCSSFQGHPTAPETPVRPYTDCVNAMVVGLRWEPADARSSGLTSVWRRPTRYTITRNGSPLAMTTETNFADTTVRASTAYTYAVTVGGTPPINNKSADAPAPDTRTVAPVPTTGAIEITTLPASPTGDAPYCKSSYIDSISWDWPGGHTEPNGSDLWPVTWGEDGNVYTFFGDGGGFAGDNYRGRVSFGVAKITAPPPLGPATVENVYGGFQAAHPSKIDGKAGALIAVGHDFYTLGGLYTEAELRGVKGHKSGAPHRVQLAYSRGNAHSWQAASWTFCSAGDKNSRGTFCPHSFINYGRGNSGAPDGYVYMLGFANSPAHWGGDDGPEVMAERQRLQQRDKIPRGGAPPDTQAVTEAGAAKTYLARVSTRHVLQRDAYRYFAGIDARGKPIWTADQHEMRSIFTDRNPTRPGCGGQCNMASPLEDVVYNPGIQRYIATAQGEYIGQTSFYDAPNPWGPWTTISYNNIDPKTGNGGWAGLGTAGGGSLGVHVVNAWTSADGLSLWVTYSSDGKAPPGALFPPEGTMLDSFNLVGAQLLLAPKSAGQQASR